MKPSLHTIPTPLLQAIVDVLNDLPSKVSRNLLNAIEAQAVELPDLPANPAGEAGEPA